MPSSELLELYAHGLGVIDDARLEFGPGFNVLTGETGAGKTLLLGALDLSLGGDGSSTRQAIMSDMRAAAVFRTMEGSEVVFARESGSSGRLRSTLNGVPSSADALRTLAEKLIVIHGQHDSLALKNRADVLHILDKSGSVSTTELDEVRRQIRQAHSLREELGGDEATRTRELEFLEFQLQEIAALKIQSIHELTQVLEELTRLTELREGFASLTQVLETLDGDDENTVLSRFARVIDQLPSSDAFSLPRSQLRDALEQARDAVHELNALADGVEFDPAHLAGLEERAGELQRVARKYGGSLESTLATELDLRARHTALVEGASRLATLDEELNVLFRRESELARAARRDREFAAVRLTEEVRRQLPRVALPNASLRFEVGGDDGSDVQILFTPNPGLPEGPLQALASGGELSRVLLALSLETADSDVVAVFDEVDAGVGGEVAQQIGQCLQEVGLRQQVLAVTHLASVAARADHHFVIEKVVSGGTTTTGVRRVEGDARVKEIARMLAGAEVTEESRALAQKLLETAR